jgi:hypothetical protein
MTTTEIAVRDTAAVTERDVVDGWAGVIGPVGDLADYIAQTDFVPRALRGKPAAVAACILTGRELGIGPMASLKSIHMVQGVPSLSAEYKRARAMAAGHEIIIDETNATRCVVRGRRSGSGAWVQVQWTLDMARRAKIAGKDVWQQYPQRMLQARATSELCDLLFPDATLGLETTEVLEDGGALAIAEGAVIEAAETPAIEPPKPDKPRTAQRKQRTQTAPPAQPHAPAATAPPAPQPNAEPAGGALPPLPGEEETTAPAPDDTDYDTPGTVTTGPTGQLTRIWATFTSDLGFGSHEKDAAREICAQIVGRHLDSSKDLSHNEARTVIDTLSQVGSRDDLMALLISVDKVADGE